VKKTEDSSEKTEINWKEALHNLTFIEAYLAISRDEAHREDLFNQYCACISTIQNLRGFIQREYN